MTDTTRTRIIAELGVPQIGITREFDASHELLFRTYTDPEFLVQWFGPRRMAMTLGRFVVRNGGSWRYTHRDNEGNEYDFHGVFHGTPTPDGIVQTFEFEGAPGHVSPETVTFKEKDGKTEVHQNAVYQSLEDRDAILHSGMEEGVNDSMEWLEELLVLVILAR